MGKNYLYISDSYDGWRNLATDEWFLDHIGPEDVVLYFYINRNAVIIGKNQNPWKECDLSAMERDGVQLVRRISGGGAVFHDCGNLNFSFNAGKNRYDKDRQHRFILETVQSLGIPCEFSGRNDLLAAGKKFSGNAYCARGDAKQHHGTLLVSADLSRLQNYLTVDPRKMQSKGVASVRSRVCNLNEFVPSLTVEELLRVIPRPTAGCTAILSPIPLRNRIGRKLRNTIKSILRTNGGWVQRRPSITRWTAGCPSEAFRFFFPLKREGCAPPKPTPTPTMTRWQSGSTGFSRVRFWIFPLGRKA